MRHIRWHHSVQQHCGDTAGLVGVVTQRPSCRCQAQERAAESGQGPPLTTLVLEVCISAKLFVF